MDNNTLRDITVCVKDIQETHGLILKRIDEIDMGLQEGTWHSCTKHSSTLMDRMVQRVLLLENKEKETNHKISRLKQCFEELQEFIKNLELNKGDLVVNLNKIIMDESCDNSTYKLPIDTSLSKEDMEINEISTREEDKHEQHEMPYESENIEVIYNDFQLENDVSDNESDTVQKTVDVGLDFKSSCRETNVTMDQPDDDRLITDSVSIETNLKSENITTHEECLYLKNIDIWNSRAKDERNAAKESGLLDARGLHTVVCVDTSASLLNDNGRSQVNEFVYDYLNGLEESATTLYRRDECVALVTFGNETHVAQRLTKDYKRVMQVYEDVKFGGPSPMYGGLAMAIAAAESANSGSANVNGMTVNTKIVLITDGKLTDSCMVKGPDVVDNQISDDTQLQIQRKVSELAARPYLNLFVVPVGNANIEFVELMVSVADGKMLRYNEGKQFSRRLLLSALAAPQGHLSAPFSESSDIANMLPLHLTEQDKEQIKQLREEGKHSGTGSLTKKLRRNSGTSIGDIYHESTDKTLPQIGSRVVKGPDWSQLHDDQDDDVGPGTIIGHSPDIDGCVMVEWDRNENISIYRYNAQLGYDVLLIDKPRDIRNERMKRIAVGCMVKPGKHFNYKGSDVNRQDNGVVIKVLTPREDRVLVKWNNFKRVHGEYSFGNLDIYELELCQSAKQEHEIASVDNHSKGGKAKSITNKNK